MNAKDRGRRVLMVNPNAAGKDSLQTLLSHYGLEVDFAATAVDAGRQLGRGPDAVLIDSDLPPGDAQALIGDIRQRLPNTRLGILLDPRDTLAARRVRSLRADAVIGKPLNLIDVLELVRPAA